MLTCTTHIPHHTIHMNWSGEQITRLYTFGIKFLVFSCLTWYQNYYCCYYYSVYTCEDTWCICVLHICAAGAHRGQRRMLVSCPTTLWLLPWRWGPWLNPELGWQPGNPRDPLSWSPAALGVQVLNCAGLAYHVGAGNVNSGIHT